MPAINLSGALITEVGFSIVSMSRLPAAEGLPLPALGLFAYIGAVAAVEAFVNETFLNPAHGAQDHPILKDELLSRAISKLGLVQKVLETSARLFGDDTLNRGCAPLQDFALLVSVRNAVTHYHMNADPPFVAVLSQRGLTRSGTAYRRTVARPWTEELCSVAGMCWAHNTAIQLVHRLGELDADDRYAANLYATNFHLNRLLDPQRLS